MKRRISAVVMTISGALAVMIVVPWLHAANLSITDLGTLGGGMSSALGINNRGQVVGLGWTASGEDHAFIWQDGVMTDLGTLGASFSFARSINERRQVLGSSGTASGEPHTFLWQNGVMTDLGTLGHPDSNPVAINDRGQIVGSSFAIASR